MVVSRHDEDETRQQVTFFLNAVKTTKDPQNITLRSPIGYIGNSRDGDTPFGVVADFRIYPYKLSKNYLVKQAKYDPALEFQMPDKYLTQFIKADIPQYLVLKIAQESETTNTTVLRMLTWFAAKREGRACLLSRDIYKVILPLQRNQNPILRLSVQKLISNLV